MNKRGLALVVAVLMILSMLPALAPLANAQRPTPSPRAEPPVCDNNHYLPTGEKTTIPMCVYLHPGVSDSYKNGWSHTLDTLWGTQAKINNGDPFPGQMDTNGQTRQVFDNYFDYAILASGSDSIGDLQFDFIVMSEIRGVTIYVPPEFKWLAPTQRESIWTDITNDYQYVSVGFRNEYDSIAPHWARVDIGDGDWEYLHILPGVYHVRFFNLRAPEVVGLYFFKIYYTDTAGEFLSLGAGNYPLTIVKGELNPAWVEVTVQTHEFPEATGALVSGVVTAMGTTPEGRSVTGMAYWGPNEFVGNQPVPPGPAGALYRAYLFGLPAGTYQIKAEASGFEPNMSDRLMVDAGQSYHMRLFIILSPTLSVTVWSKHGTGAIPWHSLWQLPYGTNCPSCAPVDDAPRRDIFFDLYDSKGNLLSFWGTDDQNENTFPFDQQSSQRGIPLNNLLASQGLQPTAVNAHYVLADNFDLFGDPRGLTSTNWEGHVPWDTPDYVQGIVQGEYTLEAFVTGYIMDEADAYQRSITVNQVGPGTHYEFQMDLRRSNWIENVIHLPSNQLSPTDVTITLTATDFGGNERGAAALIAHQAAGGNLDPTVNGAADDGVIDGNDAVATGKTPNWQVYAGGIVIEGWNDLFPNAGGYGVKDFTHPLTGTIKDNHKDYGLNPTASSHSVQGSPGVKLEGNPYTVKLYMTDMGDPSGYATGEPLPGTGWYSIAGGDPQVSVFLCNSPVSLSFSVVNASAWISLRSVDFEVPAHSRPWTFPGAEIWVNFMDMKGKTVTSLDPAIYGFFQDAGTTDASEGHVILGADRLGCPLGSYGVTPFDVDNEHCPGEHEHLGLWYYGTDYVAKSFNGDHDLWEALLPGHRSTRLPAGEYTYHADTYGYMMRRSFPMQIPAFGRADIEADLIQGGQVRVSMEFFDEEVRTAFNGWIGVEVFNAKGSLVGASIYGQAQPNVFDSTYHPYEAGYDWQIVQGPSQGADFGQTPTLFPSSIAGVSNGQRAYASNQIYHVPAMTWAGWTAMTPAEANRVQVPASGAAAVDVYGFYRYYGGPTRTWAGGWPTTHSGKQADAGIKGSVDIPGWAGSGGGLYTVKVWAFDPFGPDNDFEATGFSDDWRMYSMANELTNIQVPWGGVQELYIAMNNMAKLEGTIRWYDMFGTLRPLPWARIQATDPAQTSPPEGYPAYTSGLGAIGAGTSDSAGTYVMWLPPGSHDVSVDTTEAPSIWASPGSTGPYSSAPTYNTAYTVVVSPGWVAGGDSNLAESGTPVPEVPAFLLPLTLIAALAASVWLLRKNANTNIPVLMK